jgi:mannitol/fructose-specific phosphotransferase system IIA component (Ntr-type)
MQRGEFAECMAWLALVGGYAHAVRRLGRLAKTPSSDTSVHHPRLTLIRSAIRDSPPRAAGARRPMTISSLLTPDLVLPSLPAQAKAEVLETLAVHVGRAHPHVDARRLAGALHERERQSTTALENGIAIPHVRLTGLSAPLAALARTTDGIPCDAVDGRPTRIFLLLAVSAEQPGGLLKLLARAARLLSDGHCRARLLAAPSAIELLAALREHEEHGYRGPHAA